MLLQYKYLSLWNLYIFVITLAIFFCGKAKKDYGQNEYRFLLTDFHNFRCTGKGEGLIKYLPSSPRLDTCVRCGFDRASSLICGNNMPTRCNRRFLLQILLLSQHVSGTIMPIIRSSRVLYKWLLPGHTTLSSTPYRQLVNVLTHNFESIT